MTELKTLKNLSKTTIMVPDLTKKQPCTEDLIEEIHTPINELRDAAKNYAENIIKNMVIDSSKIGPVTTNERGVLVIEIGITSDNAAMNQAIGMLAFIKHFFNIED